jgi:hypothetical protein
MGQSFCRRKKAIQSLQLPKLVVEQCPIETVEPVTQGVNLTQDVDLNPNAQPTKEDGDVMKICPKSDQDQTNTTEDMNKDQEEIDNHNDNQPQIVENEDNDSDVLSKKYYRYVYKSLRKPEIPTIDSTTLDCSECSSDSSQNSNASGAPHHITDTGLVCGEENDQVLQNIYFDVTTLKAKLNTEQTELRNISDHVRQRYQDFCQKEKTLVCSLNYVLEGLDLPDDATHLVVSFVTYHGDQFCVPYCLNHGEDPFPFEDPEFVVSALHDEELPEFIFLHCKNEKGKLVQIDVTDQLLYFSRDVFSAGFSHFRPYCWTWLSELSSDPEAILVTQRHDEDSVKYTSLTLYHPTITEWIE